MEPLPLFRIDETSAAALAQSVPAPHVVPKTPGEASLRLAMVYDILHERFDKHGDAYYHARNKSVRLRLENRQTQFTGDADKDVRNYGICWDLMDDLAVGLERVGEFEEAIAVLRRKLQQQNLLQRPAWTARLQPGALLSPDVDKLILKARSQTHSQTNADAAGISPEDERLYKTYANLGTILIHSSFRAAMKGDAQARMRMREGVDDVRVALAINPDAHFGRERWQLVIGEFLLKTMDQPDLLIKYDMVGNALSPSDMPRRPFSGSVDQEIGKDVRDLLRDRTFLDAVKTRNSIVNDDVRRKMQRVRSQIPLIGAEDEWPNFRIGGHTKPVPFDEPVLGIIGMWTLGGGANPHFALALGETLHRTGYPDLAWIAFTRASLMADRFSTDPAIQTAFREHCLEMQKYAIQNIYNAAGHRIGMPHEKIRDVLSAAFERDLNAGLQRRALYEAFEAERLAAGIPYDAPDFDAPFLAKHGTVASPVGLRDYAVIVRPPAFVFVSILNTLPMAVIGGAIFLTAAVGWKAVMIQYYEMKRRSMPSDPK